MTPREQLLSAIASDETFVELNRQLDGGAMSLRLEALAGSAYTATVAATVKRRGGVHLIVADDRDAAQPEVVGGGPLPHGRAGGVRSDG